MVAGVLLAWCACAAALDPSLDISQYAHTAWKVRDGFSQGLITSIAQTPDGYLWLGTEFGLVRFDGNRAVPWQPPAGEHLPDSFVRTMLAAQDGTLWIGTTKGLATWKDGKLVQLPELEGRSVISLLEDREGTVWVGAASAIDNGRLCAIHAGNAQCYGADGSLGIGVSSLYEDSKGNLWAGTVNGLWHWKPGPPKFYPIPSQPPAYVSSVMEDEKGTLVIATTFAGIQQFNDGKLKPYPIQGVGWQVREAKLLRDRDGSLWIGTSDRGLVHVHQGNTDVFAHSDGLSGDWVASFLEDREGNIWVATVDGLDRFRDFAVSTISVKQGLSSASVTSVLAARDGSVWLATVDGLDRWKNGQITIYRKRNRLPDDFVDSIFQDDAGRIWVSTPHGVAYFENDRFTPVRALPAGRVVSIAEDTAGDFWIVYADQGLVHLRRGSVTEQFSWVELERKRYGTTMVFDPTKGGLWLGFSQGGVSYFKGGQVRASYAGTDGLGEGKVNDLRLDRDSTLWVATQGGLSRLKNGRVATLNSRNGLPCDAVNSVMEDDAHSLWLYMPCGLVRIAQSVLDAWITDPKRKVQVATFDSTDGVRSRASSSGRNPHTAKTPDGKLWFIPFDGVSIIDPHHLAFNKLPPPVHIEQVTADDKTYDATNGLRLPPHVRYLAIDYTALSLVTPEKVRFRYKLEGEDKNWREVVNDRQVQYTNLAPKHYRFRVLACNNSGVWNEQGASLEFVIPPAWYQTNWFYALCAATFLLLLWGLYHLRVLQLQREFNAALEGRVAERTRVARELHDTLLQSFHGLLLRFAVVQRLLPSRVEEAEKELQKAMDMAAAAITEGRDAVQGLRDSVVQGNDLARAISTVGEELVNQATNLRPTFRVTVQGESRDLHPIVRDEIYKIAAEALRNTVSHAEAKHVEVEIQYDNERFRLRVRDDGRGIDPEVIASDGRERHYGIPGMRERATVIGGKLEIWSKLDAGTELELTIPGKRAYAKSWRRSWLTFRSSEKEDESKAAGVGP